MDASFQQKHQSRTLRPGEAGLSGRRTDAGADASGARARTEGNNRPSSNTKKSARALPAHVTREAPYPKIAAKAQLSARGLKRSRFRARRDGTVSRDRPRARGL